MIELIWKFTVGNKKRERVPRREEGYPLEGSVCKLLESTTADSSALRDVGKSVRRAEFLLCFVLDLFIVI